MNPLITQQRALDDTLVAPDDRAIIGKCNMRIEPTKTQKEATYQVVLDTLKLSTCYKAFLATADVPEIYMHQFWFTVTKIKDSSSYKFKLDNKTFKVRVEVFRDVLQICPRLPKQEFIEPPSHEETVTFIKELGYKGELESIIEMFIYQMSQPWRTFASIINKCLYGKTTMSYSFYFQELKSYGVCHSQGSKKEEKAHIKESSLTADDNIISEDPYTALELAKSISRTEAEEQEAARLVHETHDRLVTKKPVVTRKQTGVVMRDTPTVSKKQPLERPQKLKVYQVMSEKEREDVDFKKAIKASKLASVLQQTTSSSEGAGLKPKVPEESTVGTGADDKSEDNWGTESDHEEDDNDDNRSIDLNKTDDEEEIYDADEPQGDEYVHEDEYVHTDDNEDTNSNNGDQEMDDAKKNDDNKAEEERDTFYKPDQDEQAKDY
ncbi:hypothetical protein Tco_0789642 [Tanacetum coccineum]